MQKPAPKTKSGRQGDKAREPDNGGRRGPGRRTSKSWQGGNTDMQKLRN